MTTNSFRHDILTILDIERRRELRHITTLSSERAKAFFLKGDIYTTILFPQYINFNQILQGFAQIFNNITPHKKEYIVKTLIHCAKNDDNVNYKFYVMKKNLIDWRPLTLINPALYYIIIDEITQEQNWSELCALFYITEESQKIICCSIPVYNDTPYNDNLANTILSWWQNFEIKSIETSSQYNFLTKTDIANFYDSIYTHSITWAIYGKKDARAKRNKVNLGNTIDSYMQALNYMQTNGIPQGSVLCDLIAEILLHHVDKILYNKIEEKFHNLDYKILRYRDDYHIFTQTEHDGQNIMKIIADVLNSFNLRLNSSKTLITHDIISHVIKQDKIQSISNQSISIIESNITELKKVIHIYDFSLQFSNSGALIRMLSTFYDAIKQKLTKRINNIPAISSILINIANNNLIYYPACFAIISLLLTKTSNFRETKNIITNVIQKFKNIPNNELIMIWIDRLILPYKKLLDAKLTDTLLQTSIYLTWIETQKGYPNTQEHNLWHINWILNKQNLLDSLTNISKNEQQIQSNFYTCEDIHTLIISLHTNYFTFWDIIHGKNSQIIQHMINVIETKQCLSKNKTTQILNTLRRNNQALCNAIKTYQSTTEYKWDNIEQLIKNNSKQIQKFTAQLETVFLYPEIQMCLINSLNNKFITEASYIEKHEFHIFTNYN